MDPTPVKLDLRYPIWDNFFMVHPLVIIGSTDKSGDLNFAPKHMAMPIGWDNFFGFVCSPRHSTYQNIRRTKNFTVSFPVPDQVVLASLTATQREEDDTKPALKALPILEMGDSKYLRGAYLFLNCKTFKIIDGFGVNSLISGEIMEAYVRDNVMRGNDRDDRDLISNSPMIAYLHPTRYAEVMYSNSFPFPSAFSK